MAEENEEKTLAEKIEESAREAQESTKKSWKEYGAMLDPITRRVRDFVLGFGEIIVTVSVVIGLISALIAGLAEMGNVGFFTGLTSMINSMVSVIMGALVIFLLFAIKKNGDS
jgi:hypothetical protein